MKTLVFVFTLITLSCFSKNPDQALVTELSRKINIDLSTQTGQLVENERVVRDFKISSGILSAPTPTGQTFICRKGSLDGKSTTRWSTAFKVEMPWAMELDFKDKAGQLRGICIHAGNLPGYPSSHACIRVAESDAKYLYQNCSVLTSVSITGSAASFYTEHFARKDLLVIDGENITFKRNPDGTLTDAFIAACKDHTLKLCRFKPGSETERTEDRSKWVIGFPFMERDKCVSLHEYESRVHEKIFVIKK